MNQNPVVMGICAHCGFPAHSGLCGNPNSTNSPPPEHIMQFFEFKHLPPALALVSSEFHAVAHRMEQMLPRNPERTVALRKLLEAKDAAVRALIAK
jgi:hypothetical protein